MSKEKMLRLIFSAYMLIMSLLPFKKLLKKINCWRFAMEEEIHAIQKNDTWELTIVPSNQKAIGIKWVYKIKRTASTLSLDDSVRGF
jgi:hypothetical protein